MAVDRSRTLRGALAGGVAAAVWFAQQPLDRRAFRFDYDDAALLGRLAAPGRGEPWLGIALHLQNGAAFGAAYALAAPHLPVPPVLRGPLAGLAEHLASWPGTALLERSPLAGRARQPRMWGSGRAFAQATWRHLLFGLVLGELERRLNPPGGPAAVDRAAAATNGHGPVEHLIAR